MFKQSLSLNDNNIWNYIGFNVTSTCGQQFSPEKNKIMNRKINPSKIISSKIKMFPLTTGLLTRQFDLI